MIRKKFYIAGPLFNSAERAFLERMRSLLEAESDVYLPHVDGSLLPNLLAAGLTSTAARRSIFADDVSALRNCDVVIAVLNGRTVDEGVAFELGVAWSLGKLCVGFKDDFRQLTSTGDNPMIEGALTKIFDNFQEMRDWLLAF